MKLPRRDLLKLTAGLALGGSVLPRAALPAELTAVKVISVPSDGTKGVLYAQKTNAFAKRGLQVDVAAMTSGAVIYAAILGGAAQFGSGNLFSVFSAYARGVPLRIVAPITLYTTDNADTFLIVRKDDPIHSARDFNGKTLGVVSVRDSDDFATRGWSDNNGGEGHSLHAVELPAAQMPAALDAERIDAGVLRPPFLTVAMASGKYRILGKPFDSIGPRFVLSCWVSTADYIAKNAVTVNSFVAAVTEGYHYINTHQPETVDLIATFAGQDPALLGRGVRSVMAESITLADVQRPLDFAVKNGLIDKTFDVKGLLAAAFPLVK
jgi:NitT/TauT family transport system substrate-binding protein